jgi:hypothetical protein
MAVIPISSIPLAVNRRFAKNWCVGKGTASAAAPSPPTANSAPICCAPFLAGRVRGMADEFKSNEPRQIKQLIPHIGYCHLRTSIGLLIVALLDTDDVARAFVRHGPYVPVCTSTRTVVVVQTRTRMGVGR